MWRLQVCVRVGGKAGAKTRQHHLAAISTRRFLSSSLQGQQDRIENKRVCVIGAGPSGTAILRAFQSAKQKGASIPEIVCYEKQDTMGGLWNFSWRTGLDANGEHVHNSMYRHLWSNGPKECLEFADYSFEEHFGHPIPSFPPREVLADYIRGRLKKAGVEHWIQCNTAVRGCEFDKHAQQFVVRSCHMPSGADQEERFDYVVCATGHFSTPNVPEFAGANSFTGRLLHAHDFRNAEEFTGKDILIIGTSYSAEDIASQCYKYGVNSVTLSYRTAPMGFKWPNNFTTVPLLQQLEGNTCTFKDGSQKNVDAIILCTGYKHHFPFMHPDLRLVTANRLWPERLHEGVVWPDNTKLFYLGMQDQWFTFNMFDAQAWYARDVMLGRICLPDRSTMQAQWEERRRAEDSLAATDEANIRFQADYVKSLIGKTDYPTFDLEGVVQEFLKWEHNKHEDIMTFRDKPHQSVMTGAIAPVHHTTWLMEKDDSIKNYVDGNRKTTPTAVLGDRPKHNFGVVPFPKAVPASFPQTCTAPPFDPKRHLQLEAPRWMRTLPAEGSLVSWCKFPSPDRLDDGSEFPGLGYSEPFRVLSDEGLAVMREVIEAHSCHATEIEGRSKSIRGLAYRSNFVRDYVYSKEVLDFLAQMTREPLTPHGLQMNGGHVNLSVPGQEFVDTWHLDSVPYVLVLMLSDPSTFQGGELQVARYANPKEALEEIKTNGLKSAPKELIESPKFPAAGYGVLLNGSKLAHCVRSVTEGNRISMINSYSPQDVFAADETKYSHFRAVDPAEVYPIETARHLAWRAQGQLNYLLNADDWGDRETCTRIFDQAEAELARARTLLNGQDIDERPYR
eukprot:TRINITY_DN32174_c0_g1_i1.p1 TRINITY_DN32174_c0_g1~~TRINITY_DN32174_c0_g1_i1.p1  ORF type:complete len:844 (+),score=131.65 TRINITY_DN32174_c0_g1_i1:147-2678(+)